MGTKRRGWELAECAGAQLEWARASLLPLGSSYPYILKQPLNESGSVCNIDPCAVASGAEEASEAAKRLQRDVS